MAVLEVFEVSIRISMFMCLPFFLIVVHFFHLAFVSVSLRCHGFHPPIFFFLLLLRGLFQRLLPASMRPLGDKFVM